MMNWNYFKLITGEFFFLFMAAASYLHLEEWLRALALIIGIVGSTFFAVKLYVDMKISQDKRRVYRHDHPETFDDQN